MADLSILAPYLQARQQGQRNRLSLLQSQLGQQRGLNQRLGLAQLEEELRRRREEAQRVAEANDPYRRAQFTELLARTANMQTPEQEYADWQRKEEYRRAHPYPLRTGAGAGGAIKPQEWSFPYLLRGKHPDYSQAELDAGRTRAKLDVIINTTGYGQQDSTGQSLANKEQDLLGQLSRQHAIMDSIGLQELQQNYGVSPQAVEDAISAHESGDITDDEFMQRMHKFWHAGLVTDENFETTFGFWPQQVNR
jgi:hypothetical protein